MSQQTSDNLRENNPTQDALFYLDRMSPQWEEEAVQKSLDELFALTHQYKSSSAYHDLLKFIGRFRFYSPFNAMLVHVQMPGATFVAPPHRWLRDYHRRIKAAARPLVILQPMGPVMFVFDVSDTQPEPKAPPLPREVTSPFEVRGGREHGELSRTIENAKRDGVAVGERQAAAQRAGMIGVENDGRYLQFEGRGRPKPEYAQVRLRYELLLNSGHSSEAKYATLVHELGHLYCGHLGTPNDKWWPDRHHVQEREEEFEAESVCYLVCTRRGIDNPSEEYLASYIKTYPETPQISLDCVMKAAALIEQMGRERLKPRKASTNE